MKSTNSSANKLTRLALTPLILLLICVAGTRSAFVAPQVSAIRLDVATVDAATGAVKNSFFLGETIAVVFSLTNQSGSPQVITVPEQVEIQVKLSGMLTRSDRVQLREGTLGGNSGSQENPDGSVYLIEVPWRTMTLAPGQRVDVRINDLYRFNAARIDDGAYTLTGVYGGTQQAQTSFTVAIDEPRTIPVLQQLTGSSDDADKRWANAYLDLINKPSVSGSITDAGGAPLSGVTIYVTGSGTANINTRVDGKYDLIQLAAGGNYTLTPSREGYTFQPAVRTFTNLTGRQTNMNFTATQVGAGVNVAEGATVTASSQHTDFPAENVVDGSTDGSGWGLGSGGWQDDTVNAFPDWIEVNFGSAKAIDWINVFTVQDNYANPVEPTPTLTFSQFGIVDFDVQYWNGSAFVNVPGGAINGNNLVWRKVTFPTVTTSKIRVSVRSGGSGKSSITEIQAFHQNVVPTVSITGNYSGAPGATFQFTNNAADSDGTISRYDWDFGDGSTGTGSNPSHAYSSAGTFTVTLTVTDDAGATAKATKTVTITALPQPPVASPGGPYNGFAGSPVIFEGRGSSDPDGSITSYQWNFGDSTSGTGATPSHTYAQVGTYTVTLVVTDNSGSTASQTTTATIATSPVPVVTMTAPVNGAAVAVGSTVRLIASVSSPDPIISVQFFQGATLLGNGTLVTPATTPPSYFFDWTNVPAGSYVITTKATKTGGVVGTSAPINLTVSAPPTVTITAPANNATFTAPASITVSANAAASTGNVSNVEFFQGGTKIGEDNSAPYSIAWNNVAGGSYQLTAKVTDSNNFTATSAPVTVVVNGAPTVNITSPASGQSFAAPANISISATAADADGTIAKVDFYNGATLIGTATAAPFTVAWNNVPAGNYSLTAKATDNSGAATTSAPVNVNVNAAPTVTIVAPANNATFPPGSNIQITSSASDSDGTISKVEIYQGATLLGQAASGINYLFMWNNVAAGTYTLTAKATDNGGAVTISAPINVTVSDPVPPGSVIFGDDFNDNTLDPTKWSVNDPNSPAVVTEQGQRLQITLPASTAAYNGITSLAAYDLRGRTVQLELAQAISQAGWVENSLQVILDSQNYYLINVGAGSMLFRSMVNGANDQTVIGFDQAGARYWRIRHDAGLNTINFETSANGVSWTTQKAVAPGFSLAAVKFNLMSGAWGTGNSAPGAAKYDNFQLYNNGPDSSLIITNSGFETPRLLAGASQYAPMNAVWFFSNAAGISANGSAFTNGNPAAPEGTQVAFLQTDSAAYFSQPIGGFQAGTQYTISFSAAQRANCCGGGGADFQVYLDNNLLATIRPAGTSYTSYSTSVLGVAAGTHTLKFAGLNSSGGDNTAFIDNVRVIAGGASPSFFDDFNAASLDATKWTVADPSSPVVVSQQGQQLRITLPASTAAYNGIVTNSSYDMRGKTMQVEVAQTVSQAGWSENFIEIALDAQNYYLIDVGAGSMVFRSMVNGVNDQTVISYDQGAFPYWRIRHDATTNMVSFETSSDGVYWNTRKRVAASFSLAAVKFQLYAGAWGTGNAAPGAAKYDNVQLLDSSNARVGVALTTNGGSAALSSQYAANYPAAAAINGDRYRLNSPDGNYNMAHSAVGAPKPDWLQVDFNGTKTIEEIDVVTTQDNFSNPAIPTEAMTFTTYGITAFEVQYWNGSAWVTVPGGSVTANNKVWRKFTFSPIVTTKVRVLVSASSDNLTRIMELEAWSTGGASQNSARFIQTDSSTQGNWKGVFGTEGYSIANDATSLPAYAQMSMTGQTPFTWAASSMDIRALRKAISKSDRLAACWYSATNFTIDLNLTDGQEHVVALYGLDWDSNNSRVAKLEVLDAATNTVLANSDLASYTSGKYLIFNLKGHVLLRLTNLPNSPNAAISGLFFGTDEKQD